MRLLVIFITATFLSACATQLQHADEKTVGAGAITAHQASLAPIIGWEFQSRMAFADLQQNSRQSASLRWQHSPAERSIRISHPLRGTIARIHATPELAVLTDNQGHEYQAESIQTLLITHLNIVLPIELIHDALLGRIPDAELINPRYYEDGTLAQYEVDLGTQSGADSWVVELSRYQVASNETYLLPHQLNLRSNDYEILLMISRWTITESALIEEASDER